MTYEKRAALQLRIRFKHFAASYIEPFFEVLDELMRLGIKHRIASFRCIPQEFHSMLQEYVQAGAVARYNCGEAEIRADDKVITQLLEAFPGVNPLRYVPALPLVAYGDDLTAALHTLAGAQHINEREVYVCWLKYAFLLEINLQDLAQKANNEIINSWHGDTVITPEGCNWLIAYSLEDEWRFGLKKAG